jgi:SAM-dependent methyltransferase
VTSVERDESYGQHGLSPVDRFGVWLSLRAIRRHVTLDESARVVDLGCGYEATLLRTIAGGIASGIGVDLRVSDATKEVPRLSFIELPIEDALPRLEPASADVIFAISVLEHLADPNQALRECHRVLAADGKLVVNVPTWRGKRFLELSAFRLGLSPAVEMDDHKMYYDSRDLWPLFVRAGFRPSGIKMRRHKFGLNLFAVAHKRSAHGDGGLAG